MAVACGSAGEQCNCDDGLRDIRRERSLRQNTLALTGIWCLLTCTFGLAMWMEHIAPDEANGPQNMVPQLILLCASLVASIVGCVVTVGVFRFSPGVKKLLCGYCIVSLILFPLGTAFSRLIFLEAIWKTSPSLLSVEYQRAVARSSKNPHRMSAMGWIAVVLLLCLVAAFCWVIQLPEDVRHMNARARQSQMQQ